MNEIGGPMTAREFLTNVAVIVAVMAVAALIETVVPMSMARPWRHGRRVANLGLTAVSFGANWALSSVAAVAAISLRPARLLARTQWPVWAPALAGIWILGFSLGYLSPRTVPIWPPLWPAPQL